MIVFVTWSNSYNRMVWVPKLKNNVYLRLLFGKVTPLKKTTVFISISILVAHWDFYRQALWMKHWGHSCLKRTLLWSTSDFISKLNLGKIQKTHHKLLVKTVKQYIDKSGKRRFHGTKALKATEFLTWLGCAFICCFGSSLIIPSKND